jgi:glycosyltransferase involved in cell wall biosynthesis
VHGVTELVGRDESAGLLVEPTADSVAKALIRLAEDADLRHRMGEVGRARAEQRTWDAVGDGYRAVYRSCRGGRRAGEASP